MTSTTALRRSAPLLLVAALLAGCSSGDKTVDRADVEKEAATQLAAQVNQPEPDISCPDDLDAKVGATMECELSVKGDDAVYPVHIKVTSVKDGDAKFDVEVGDTPKE